MDWIDRDYNLDRRCRFDVLEDGCLATHEYPLPKIATFNRMSVVKKQNSFSGKASRTRRPLERRKVCPDFP